MHGLSWICTRSKSHSCHCQTALNPSAVYTWKENKTKYVPAPRVRRALSIRKGRFRICRVAAKICGASKEIITHHYLSTQTCWTTVATPKAPKLFETGATTPNVTQGALSKYLEASNEGQVSPVTLKMSPRITNWVKGLYIICIYYKNMQG